MGSVGVRNVWTVLGQCRSSRKREGNMQETEDELRTTTNDESKLPSEILLRTCKYKSHYKYVPVLLTMVTEYT